MYTGGGPANATSATLGGYINQTIKTGTFPGYTSITAGMGAPAFYHQIQVEAGGATPDRIFSWYVGLRGTDMIPDQIDWQNGANLAQDGNNAYGLQGVSMNAAQYPLYVFGAQAGFQGPWSTCLPNGRAPRGSSSFSPLVSSDLFSSGTRLAACNAYGQIYGALTTALERE